MKFHSQPEMLNRMVQTILLHPSYTSALRSVDDDATESIFRIPGSHTLPSLETAARRTAVNVVYIHRVIYANALTFALRDDNFYYY